jgi:hypothetical protein
MAANQGQDALPKTAAALKAAKSLPTRGQKKNRRAKKKRAGAQMRPEAKRPRKKTGPPKGPFSGPKNGRGLFES